MHAFAATVTNAGSIVPTCQCGWIGTVHAVPVTVERGGRKKRHAELAARAAHAEYDAHAFVLQPAGEMRNYRCEVCRRELVMPAGSVACPHDGGSLGLARSRA